MQYLGTFKEAIRSMAEKHMGFVGTLESDDGHR